MSGKPLPIEKIQELSLDILKKVIVICSELDLRYYIFYGSLIGAVRHRGFIPWDDDLDIMMPRPDYERLIAYFLKHKNDLEPLELYEPRVCEQYPYMIARVSDNRYLLDVDNEKDYGIGIFIDIYPFDGLGDTVKEAFRYGMKGDRLSSLCFQATRERFVIGTTKSLFRKLIKRPVFWMSKMIGRRFFQSRLVELAGRKDYNTSKYVGCVVWLSGGMKDIFKREWFDEAEELLFAGVKVKVPKKYDMVLRHIYGDYMQLPPPEERIGHHYYQAYKK